MVQDFQTLYYLANYYMLDPKTDVSFRIVFPIVIVLNVWEGQFWNVLLSPLLIIALPLLAAFYYFDFQFLSSMFIKMTSTTMVLKDMERMVDTTTLIVWGPLAYFFGYNLIQEDALPTLMMIQWALIPFNSTFFGLWTLLLFPFSALASGLSIFFVYLGLG